MDDCLAAVAVLLFLFDDGRPVTDLALLDHRGSISIAIHVVRLSHRRAHADRADADADIVGQSGRCECGQRRRDEQCFFRDESLLMWAVIESPLGETLELSL